PVDGRAGKALLFQVLRLSTIGAGKFNGRVRDGIGFSLSANTTRPAKDGNEASASGANIRAKARSAMQQQNAFLFQCTPNASRGKRMGIGNESNQDNRAISTGKLN